MRDMLNDHAKNMMLFDKKSSRVKQVKKKLWKKFEKRLDNAKMCDILSDHAKQHEALRKKNLLEWSKSKKLWKKLKN